MGPTTYCAPLLMLDVMTPIGTMGVYGYGTAGVRVPEGYLPVIVRTDAGPQETEILYPADPGSVYHMTKTSGCFIFPLLQ